MKKMILPLLAICLCLTGCSNKVDVNGEVHVDFDGSSFKVEGKDLPLTKYTGSEAIYENNGALINVSLEQCDDLAFAMYNTQAIMIDDMDMYRNKAYTWSMYLGTENIMYYPYYESDDVGVYWISMDCLNVGQEQGNTYMWDIGSNLKMTNGSVIVDCGSDITFKCEYGGIGVTNEYASIPGTINVKKYTKPECTEPFTVVQDEKNTFTLYKYESGQYVYYQYKDWVIQTLLGVDISEYIILH